MPMEEIKKVYGPYVVTDSNSKIYGRKQILLVYKSGRKRTLLYSRYLMEQHLGRELDPNSETVDHIDGDITNDTVDNLRILPRKEHLIQDSKRVSLVELICVWCGKSSSKSAAKLDYNAKQGKAGPFCGNSCAGSYRRALQLNEIEAYPTQDRVPVEDRDYFYFKDICPDNEENIDKVVKEALKAKEQKQKEKEAKKKYCSCGKQISYRADKCKACVPKSTVIQWPEPHEVLRMVQATNFSKAGKELGVSDNAIRKFLKKHELSV